MESQQAGETLAEKEEMITAPNPTEEPFAVDPAEEGESLFFEDVASGRFPMLQAMGPHPCMYWQH